MTWFTTSGSGASFSAGTRPGADSHNGNAVMYDARNGKILTVGGSSAFSRPEFPGTGTTVIITINGVNMPAQTKVVGSLNKPRVYGSAVVLPDSRIALMGGAAVPKEFNDDTAIFEPGTPLSVHVCLVIRSQQIRPPRRGCDTAFFVKNHRRWRCRRTLRCSDG